MASAEPVELEGEVGGQKFKYSGPLNTLFTILGTFGVGLLVYLAIQHDNNQKESSRAFVDALMEQTDAMRDGTAASREQTCLLKFDQKDRQQNAGFCEQVSGASRPRRPSEPRR